MAEKQQNLARTFHACFCDTFSRECALKSEMLPLWQNKPQWTALMLEPSSGLLPRVAMDCARRTSNEPCAVKSEWHKFDLMLVSAAAGREWWESVPIVTVEHENDNNIQEEIWKLACWKSRLKVLITYHDDSAQEAAKRELASRIILNVQTTYESERSEWLLLSASRTWGDELVWRACEWAADSWQEL